MSSQLPGKHDRRQAVPESEIRLDFVRSSGPGGQNVNKTSSKVQLRWNVGGSQAFTDEEKAVIRRRVGKRLNSADDIVLASQAERSQSQNREEAVARLQELVAAALRPRKARLPTGVSRAQKKRRLEMKRRVSDKKRRRRPPAGEW